MKKILSVIVLVLMISICGTVNAAGGSATINGNNSVTVGSNIVFTVNVSGCGNASSVAVNVSFGSNFEFVSAEWLKGGMINNPYDANTRKGALGGLSSPDINGNLYRLTLKAKTANANTQTVKIGIIAKNGSIEIFNNVVSKSVKINCATHSYGAWTKVDATNHKHTCSYCGNVETKGHSWNGGEITKNASCKDTGSRKYTCTDCCEIKNEIIAKTNNHSFGDWRDTKNPSCTEKGIKTRTCSVCQKNETADIDATGHSMGGWTTTTEAKCTINGTQTRKCSKCSHAETRSIDALGHSFSSPSITKQPTCTETGIESGKCSRCGQTTTNTIKPKGHKFGNWTVKTSATCISTGVEERKCYDCSNFETRNIEALGHDFENPIIVKESTLTTTGLKEGKCKRCNETTSEIIPCSAKDEITGAEIELDEGVFQEGTTMEIEEIKENTPRYEKVKSALKEITEKFVATDVSAVLNNAEVQPNGIVKLILKSPTGFSNNLALYFVADDGTIEKLEAKVNDNGTISADVAYLGSYAICDLDATVDADLTIDNDEDKNTEGKSTDANNIAIYIIIGIVVLIIIGIVIAIVIIKKKKENVE